MSVGSEEISAHGGSQAVRDFYDGERLTYPAEAEREPYPAPKITSRDAAGGAGLVPVVWPSAVLRVERRAKELGWATSRQYARGRFPNLATGRPGAEYESWAVRVRRGDWGAYGVYANGAWTSVMLWGAGLPWFPLASVADLEGWLAEPAQPAGWYDAIRLRRAAAAERAKLRAKCNTGVHARPVPAAGIGPQGTWCALCGNGWADGAEPWRKAAKGREGMS